MKSLAHFQNKLPEGVRRIIGASQIVLMLSTTSAWANDALDKTTNKPCSDPFIGSNELATDFDGFELGRVTLLTAQEAFGIPEWSLDAWPEPVQEEIRIYFRPINGNRTQLLRLAISDDWCWIERRTTSPTRGITRWGTVEERVAVRVKHNEEMKRIIRIAQQEKLYKVPTDLDSVILNDPLGTSVWMLDSQSKQRRRSLIIENVDVIPWDEDNEILKGLEFSRDFTQYKQIWDALTQLLESELLNSP